MPGEADSSQQPDAAYEPLPLCALRRPPEAWQHYGQRRSGSHPENASRSLLGAGKGRRSRRQWLVLRAPSPLILGVHISTQIE
jgi:hypothetical protein